MSWRRLLGPDPDRAWEHDAECRGTDEPDVFFPGSDSGLKPVEVEEAKSICQRCPVMSDCLVTALERREPYGVWGGLDEDERRALLGGEETADARPASAP